MKMLKGKVSPIVAPQDTEIFSRQYRHVTVVAGPNISFSKIDNAFSPQYGHVSMSTLPKKLMKNLKKIQLFRKMEQKSVSKTLYFYKFTQQTNLRVQIYRHQPNRSP